MMIIELCYFSCFLLLLNIDWSHCSQLARAKRYMGAKMGVAKSTCDDGKTNLTTDWPNFNFTVYSCPSTSAHLPVEQSLLPTKYYQVPNFDTKNDDIVYHHCMNTSIIYNSVPPLWGDHRPLWAKFGEYLFLPEQRWLHNLEHGSIALLYHPCVNQELLNELRQIVKSCMYRYVITPYQKLNESYPMTLVAWGAKLEINTIKLDDIVDFIKVLLKFN